MAHEFSHILNGDMRLNIRLMGLLNGILGLAIIGRILLEFTSREERILPSSECYCSFWGVPGSLASGSRVTVSRQREYLADVGRSIHTQPGGDDRRLEKSEVSLRWAHSTRTC